MTVDRWLVFEPLDTVMVRDGRAFDAGVQAVARAILPQPSTVAGAVGAAFGAPPGAGTDPRQRGLSVPQEVRGPVVVVDDGGGWRPLFPVSLDVVFDAHGRPRRLGHGELDDVEHDLDSVVLLAGKGDSPDRWWPATALRRYLHEGTPSPGRTAPWARERRVGLARNPDRTAAAGMLYSAEHLRGDQAQGRLGFAVECAGSPDQNVAVTVCFGGRSRRARVHTDNAGSVLGFPDPPDDFPDGKLLLYLATPGIFADGWRPPSADLLGGKLITAAMGGPQVVAMAQPDRRTGAVGNAHIAWAVAAGSVYYLKFVDEAAAKAASRRWHGHALPQTDETLRTAGFGLALTGRWR